MVRPLAKRYTKNITLPHRSWMTLIMFLGRLSLKVDFKNLNLSLPDDISLVIESDIDTCIASVTMDTSVDDVSE